MSLFDIVKRWFGIYRVHNHRESDHKFSEKGSVLGIGNMQYFTTSMHILQKSILILDLGHIFMNYVPSPQSLSLNVSTW